MKCCKTRSVVAAAFIGAMTVGSNTIAAASPHHATANARAATVTNVQILNASGRLCLDAENDARHNPSQNGDKVQLWACLAAPTNMDRPRRPERRSHHHQLCLWQVPGRRDFRQPPRTGH